MTRSNNRPVAFDDHNHQGCIALGLEAAEKVCLQQNLNLTPIRRRVLEILLSAHRAMGAYDVLEELAKDNHRAQPPVAYRALDFLVRAGLAHRIERLNAFIACAEPADCSSPGFLICTECHGVAETTIGASGSPMDQTADAIGFSVDSRVVEMAGRCQGCQDSST